MLREAPGRVTAIATETVRLFTSWTMRTSMIAASATLCELPLHRVRAVVMQTTTALGHGSGASSVELRGKAGSAPVTPYALRCRPWRWRCAQHVLAYMAIQSWAGKLPAVSFAPQRMGLLST